MGVLNVTPDSFYDGGRHAKPVSAYDHGMRLVELGADVIDVGGESSRPGAKPVSATLECERVVPVIEKIRASSDVPISIDTTKEAVARSALEAGATWINDISAGRFDNGMAPLAAERGCPVVLMHSRHTPEVMQEDPHYDDPVREVRDELAASVERFRSHGVPDHNIVLDPGIGFAKRIEDNLAILKGLEHIAEIGFPILVGTSRKSFIGKITGKDPDDRLCGSLGSLAAAYAHGARLFRVHDVGETRDFLSVLTRIEQGQ
jgi:dihydropteroate synthase